MFAAPYALTMEYDALDNVMMTGLPHQTFYTLNGGVFSIASKMPGIGITLDPEFTAKYTVRL
jgi:hypothetical protein